MKRVIVLFGLLFGFFALAGGWFWKSTAVSPAAPWSFSNTEGESLLWLKGSDNDTLTMDGSNVVGWASKVGTWTYTNASATLTKETVNGVQCVGSAGSNYLQKQQDALIFKPDEKFILFAVVKHDSTPIISGIIGDSATGFSMANFESGNDANWGRYSFVTNDGRFSTIRFNTASPVPSTNAELIVLTYDGVNNDSTGWTAQIDASSVDAVAGTNHPDFGGFGRLFDNTLGYYFIGKICEIAAIKNYTETDKTNGISALRTEYTLW